MTITRNAPLQSQAPLGSTLHTPHSGAVGHPRSQHKNYELVTAPACARCKTSSYIYIEEFIPPEINDDGELTKLGEASYFCTRCVEYAAHAVPPLWTPDGYHAG